MPPQKRQNKSNKTENKRKKKKPVQSSDSEFDSDVDNGNGIMKPSEIVDEGDFVDENNDESLWPKASPVVGRLLVCGGTNWDLIGRKMLPKSVKDDPNASNGMCSILFD